MFERTPWMNRAGDYPGTDRAYFAHLTRAVMGSGLGPRVVEGRWPNIASAFHDFDLERVAAMTTRAVFILLSDPDVIRNRRKLKATISNALTVLRLIKDHGSLQLYLDTLVAREGTSQGQLDAAAEVLAETFTHLGRTSALYFLYASGYRAHHYE
jgi:3-methyladenine DNA glycosylase Tag